MQDVVTVARELLGKCLVHRTAEGETSGIIVETEAYAGHTDAACHSYKRKSPGREPGGSEHRTNIMFAKGGYAYVYLIYGMYNCFNVVANVPDNPEAVLIRAVEPISGLDLMKRRRNMTDSTKNLQKNLCSGPGKLCIAMGITRQHYGLDLCRGDLFITPGRPIETDAIQATPRINVSYAGEDSLLPYRFVLKDSQYLSTKQFLK